MEQCVVDSVDLAGNDVELVPCPGMSGIGKSTEDEHIVKRRRVDHPFQSQSADSLVITPFTWRESDICKLIRMACVYHACQRGMNWKVTSKFIGNGATETHCVQKYKELSVHLSVTFRKWEPNEDNLLFSALSDAQAKVPDRYRIQCIIRSMFLRTGNWTAEEEFILMKFVTKHWVENPKAPVDWKLLSSKLLDKTPRRCHERYMLRCAMYPTVRLGPFSSAEEAAICARLSACTSLADVNVRDVVELMGGRRMGMQCECVIAQLVNKGKVCIDAEKEDRLVNIMLPQMLLRDEENVSWKRVSAACGDAVAPEVYRAHWHHVLKPKILERRRELWTAEEDGTLRQAIALVGNLQTLIKSGVGDIDWTEVAEKGGLKFKTAQDCQRRYALLLMKKQFSPS